MPALPTIAHTFRVALGWTGPGGQIAVNVIHITDLSNTATSADVATTIDAAADGVMFNCVVPGASVTDFGITPLDGGTATSHIAPATPAHWTGQNGTDFVPQVAVLIKLGTLLRGRSNRGRVFLPFIAETQITNGLLDSTSAGLITAAWNDFQDDLLASAKSMELVVASYKHSIAHTVQQPISCEIPLGTQRRRQGRLRGA